MAGVTSLPVRVKFWRGARLSGPAIMVCTNVLVSQSKHSKSCYLLSFSLLLSNSAPFFFFSWSEQSGAVRRRREAAQSGSQEIETEENAEEEKEEKGGGGGDGKTDACKHANVNRLEPQVCPLNHVWNAGKHTTYWSSSRHVLLFSAVSERNKKNKQTCGLEECCPSLDVQRTRCITARWSSGQRPPLPPSRARQLV